MSKKINSTSPVKNRGLKVRHSNFILRFGFTGFPVIEVAPGIYNNPEGMIYDADWFSPDAETNKKVERRDAAPG